VLQDDGRSIWGEPQPTQHDDSLGESLVESLRSLDTSPPEELRSPSREEEARSKARQASTEMLSRVESKATAEAADAAERASWSCEWCGCGDTECGGRGAGPSGSESLCVVCHESFERQEVELATELPHTDVDADVVSAGSALAEDSDSDSSMESF
jgi:hypothetical protein